MSRIGKDPVPLPDGVDVKVDGSHVTVKGPKGTLERDFSDLMSFNVDDGPLSWCRPTMSARRVRCTV